ncbi:unnamed protein product [Leptidea sinapis]|uniref:Peptidase M14 domain-containing protein n=1 Tax=Leptidea sinapis TaxID=189913 RepID=A0A5E4QHY8_9NEOP|nr:unnamed protein product [Leptidea sinapis]
MEPIIILITILSITASAEYVSYKDYKVLEVLPKSEKDVKVLNDLKFSDSQFDYYVWSEVVSVNRKVKIMVEPKKQATLQNYLSTVGLEGEMIIEDVQSLIDQQMQRPAMLSNSSEYNWQYYQSMEEIDEWMEKIASQYSDIATIVTAGSSNQGHVIKGIKIDFKKKENPVIGMIESGLHAREWITPATATWMINEFLTSSNTEIRNLAENVVWHIFPVLNPDGYKYTFTDDRMWRKNRNTKNHVSCSQYNLSDDMSNGVDLNRNFGFLWMVIGASQNPCAQTYAGPAAFSEPEARAIANYVLGLQKEGNLVYYLALHSYSQMILVPYSHLGGEDVLQLPNYDPVTGSGFDWVKGEANVPIVLLYELRDVGQYGFLLPAHEIIPNNEEFMDSLVEIDRVARTLNYYQSSANIFSISSLLITLTILSMIYSTVRLFTNIKMTYELLNNYKFLKISFTILCLTHICIAVKTYESYKVYSVIPINEVHLQILTDLRKEGFEFWTEIVTKEKDVRIIVSPAQDYEFLDYMKNVGLNPVLSIPNVQSLINDQLNPATNIDRSSSLGSFSWDKYQNLDQIHSWLDELETSYPGIVSTVTIGNSNENRPIKGVIIDFKSGERGESPVIGMIEGGIHAREWISPATVTWIIKEFITSDNPDVRFMAEAFVWHIFPVVNPDGYVYTFTDDRMWRKNRNYLYTTNCSSDNDLSNGIDLNRNFDYQWMTVGASSNPCDQTFAGPTPASEPETQAISAHVERLKQAGDLIYYIAFHSYSQMILIPYNAVTGSSFDWVKGIANVPIVYLFELRDVGQYGFLLPTDQIIPNNEEIMACLLEMDKTTRVLGYYSSGSGLSIAFGLIFSIVLLVVVL